MKKKLDENAIANELRGNSLFFRPKAEAPADDPVSVKPQGPQAEKASPIPSPTPAASSPPSNDTTIPRYRDTVIPRHHDTTVSPTANPNPLSPIEYARRAVKQLGKEAATHRFTVEEKRALKAIERDYEERGVRTSENEITRIAINYILQDYQSNKTRSILARVLEMLHS